MQICGICILIVLVLFRPSLFRVSSNVNEVIRAVLNSLFIYFFYEKILHAPKPPKALKAPKAQRRNQAKAQNATSKQ